MKGPLLEEAGMSPQGQKLEWNAQPAEGSPVEASSREKP